MNTLPCTELPTSVVGAASLSANRDMNAVRGISLESFRARVRVSNNGCWEWVGSIAVARRGYGVFYVKRKQFRAHRISWMIHNGPIPEGLLVCHRCDNPPCVNPAHLFLGTYQDNATDMIQKGRNANVPRIGILNGRSKLTDEKVAELRRRSKTERWPELAVKFGITLATVHQVVLRKTWKHVP